MTTIQFPLYTGESYTATLYQINGTQIQADVPASEIVPGVFNVDFATIPNGFYRIVASSNGAPLFTDTVEVVASNEINNVSSEIPVSEVLVQLINNIATEVGNIKKLGEEINHERIGGGTNNDIVRETRV